MVFAAGLGTRLRPHTLHRPKALMSIEGTALLEIALDRLQYYGCTGAIVNVHHFGDQIIDFIETRHWGNMEVVISDERACLLDTGGGLKKASWYLKDAPFVIYNADILTTIHIADLYQAHLHSGALATLAVRHRDSSRVFLFDENDELCGWRNTKTGEERLSRPATHPAAMAFSGIHVASPAIYDFMPADKQVFSMVDVYLEAAKTNPVTAFCHDNDLWLDIGSLENLARAQQGGLKVWLPGEQ